MDKIRSTKECNSEFIFGIKFHEDLANKTLIEKICNIAENENHKIKCVHRDLEKWGEEIDALRILCK